MTAFRASILALSCLSLLPAQEARPPIAAAKPPVAVQGLRSPVEVLGHEIGADGFLADYSSLVAYWEELAQSSDRMLLDTIGRTLYGQDQVVALISSPANLGRLEDIRESNRRLALGRDEDESVARELARDGRAVVWIDAGMHATESIAAQNILELVWQMVSRNDDEVRRILDEVVLIVCPANPDGMEMVAKGYMATGRVGRLPVLYQRYVGHDNNRDHYAANQLETRNITRMLYRHWLPQIIYNHHQSAPRGTILFTPPFRDPFNYNIDPLVIRGIELVSAHMNHRFSSEGKPGVISRSGASYSTWWNGGLRTAAYFHNQIGILTEVFGSPDPTEIRQTLSRRLPYSDYPDPVPTQIWHARQTIEYLQTANFAILDLAARYRERLKLDQWRMARRQIERGSRDHWTPTPRLLEIARERDDDGRDDAGVPPAFEDPSLRDPRHYVLPIDQSDPAAVVRLVRALRRTGVEVERTTETTDLGWQGSVPAGSYVVRAAQAFRAQVRDMLEPQWHPDDLDAGDPVRPYDSSGWTLSMQMGVDVLRVLDGVEFATESVAAVEVPFRTGLAESVTLDGEGAFGWLLDARNSNIQIAVNRLLSAGVSVEQLESGFVIGTSVLAPGSLLVPNTDAARQVLEMACRELGLEAHRLESEPTLRRRPLRPARIGVLDVYGGDMGVGWMTWVLEQFEFPYQKIYGDRIERGALAEDFDVLLIGAGLPPTSERRRRALAMARANSVTDDELVEQLKDALPAFEDWSQIDSWKTRVSAETGLVELREFVERGGHLCAFGSEARAIVDHFELPLREGLVVQQEDGTTRPVDSTEWFVPGSLLALDVDIEHPLGFGSQDRQVAMFRRSPVFWSDDSERARVVASYVTTGEVLRSGWAIGEDRMRGGAAIVEVPVGRGGVTLFGPDVSYRGQPVGTFRFVFNAIRSAGR